MIYPDDAKAFSTVMDIVWQSCHKTSVDKQTKQYWFSKLQHIPIGDVENAFDRWLIENTKLPTLNDILSMCKPKQDFYKALPSIRNEEIQQQGLAKINRIVEESLKEKVDLREWARKILLKPKNYPDISIKFAKEALGMAIDE